MYNDMSTTVMYNDNSLGVAIAILVPLAAYLLHRSLYVKPLPGIPVAFPPGRTSIPWFVGFGLEISKIIGGGQIPNEFLWEAGQGRPIFQVPVGPAGTWLSRWFGIGQHIVCCTDVQEHEDAFNRRSAIFSRGAGDSAFFAFALPRGMFTLDSGPSHRHHRRIFGPSMSTAWLATILPRLEHHFDQLVELWQTRISLAQRLGEDLIDGAGDLRLATIDAAASIALGSSFDSVHEATEFIRAVRSPKSASVSPPRGRVLSSAFVLLDQTGQAVLQGPFTPIYNWYCGNIRTDTKHARRYLVQFAEERIAGERLARESQNSDGNGSTSEKRPTRAVKADHVLGMLLDSRETELARGIPPLPQADLVDGLLQYLYGGTDTVGTALSWTVKLLSRHPEAQERLREELSCQLPTALQPANTAGGLEYDVLQDETRLPYLHAVVWECLRVGRVAGAGARTTTCDTSLLGYPVPKGTLVAFMIGRMGVSVGNEQGEAELQETHDERELEHSGRPTRYGRWDQDTVDLFRPERWLQRRNDGVEIFDRMAGPCPTFGIGPRGCFGKPLALLEMKVAIAKLVGAFHFERVPEELDSDEVKEVLVRRPLQVNLHLKPYESVALP